MHALMVFMFFVHLHEAVVDLTDQIVVHVSLRGERLLGCFMFVLCVIGHFLKPGEPIDRIIHLRGEDLLLDQVLIDDLVDLAHPLIICLVVDSVMMLFESLGCGGQISLSYSYPLVHFIQTLTEKYFQLCALGIGAVDFLAQICEALGVLV